MERDFSRQNSIGTAGTVRIQWDSWQTFSYHDRYVRMLQNQELSYDRAIVSLSASILSTMTGPVLPIVFLVEASRQLHTAMKQRNAAERTMSQFTSLVTETVKSKQDTRKALEG